MSAPIPKPLRISFPEADLQRLQARLDDAHLPQDPIVPNAEWKYGTELGKLKQVVEDWKKGTAKDASGKFVGPGKGVVAWWRSVEERLNRNPHFLVDIEGISLHFSHIKSSRPDAIPLIFSHGWPGSFFEADLLISRLTSPSDPGAQAFHVVVPSLPGYGLSGPPPRQGWTLEDTARVFDALMTRVLGYEAYAAHGGDWGYAVTRCLANHPGCKAYHTNFAPPNPPIWATMGLVMEKFLKKGSLEATLGRLYDQFEVHGIARALEYQSIGNGYYRIQSTKPSTVGYGMHDSPVAILSYLLEKFHEWSDPRCPAFAVPGKVEPSSGITDENILINTTLYYLSGTISTSFLPYFESGGEGRAIIDKLNTDRKFTAPSRSKPFGHSAFPEELAAGPKSWLPRTGVNLVWYRRHEYGGHFAALDNPNGLAGDLIDFFSQHWPR